MKEKSVQRLLVFVPPRRSMSGRAQLSSGTIVSYVAMNGLKTETGETPIALLPKAGVVDMVFDNADVFVTAIEAPKISEGKLRMALPNMLEDRLLSDPADCHFAFNVPRPGKGDTIVLGAPARLPVAVVDRGLLTRALDVFNESGVHVRSAYDEIYVVPAPVAGVLSIRADRGRAIARSAKHDGFSFDFDGDRVPAALTLAIRQLGIERVQAFGRDAAKLQSLAPALGVSVELTNRDLDLASTDDSVNLLQGTFAQGGMFASLMPGSAGGGFSLASLKVPAVWLGVAAAVFVVGMNVYWIKLDSESKSIRGSMETSFRSTFPEETTVPDAIAQTKRKLGDLRSRAGIPSAEDFSVLNARAAQLLSTAPLGIVTGIEYREGALKLKLKPGAADNPGLQNSLRAAAIQLGLAIRFEPDGSARLSTAGS